MFLTPYDTTTLSNYNMSKTKALVEQEYLSNKGSMGILYSDRLSNEVHDRIYALNSTDGNLDIPIFSQPLLFNIDPVRNDHDDNRFVIDCRGFTSKDRNGVISISKIANYRQQVINAILCNYWYFNGQTLLLNLSKFPVKVFSNWITSSLSRKLNLEDIAQVRTNAIIAYYFTCLFNDYPSYGNSHVLDDDKAYITAVKVSYATGLKTNDALDIIKQIPTMNNINDLCSALKQHGGSDRFKILNTPVLYSLLGRTAMNGYSPETIIASLEYPPLFLGMVYTAGSERGYNKSDIGNIVHNARNDQDLKHFIVGITNILHAR